MQSISNLYPGLDESTLEKIANFTCVDCTHDQVLAKWVSIFPDGAMVPVVILFEGQPTLDDIKANKTIDYTENIAVVKSYGGNVTSCFSLLVRGCGANIPKDRVFDLANDPRVASVDANGLGRAAVIIPNPSIIRYPHFDNSTNIPNSTKKIAYWNNVVGIGNQIFSITDKVDAHLTTLLSPLKQFKSGIAAKDVTCKGGLHLVIKAEDGSPACVKPDTAQKLVERGWAREMIQAPIQSTSSRLKTNETAIQVTQTIPPCVSSIPHRYAIAGPPGTPLCPITNFEASGKILNATGFYGIYNYTAFPTTVNFVLEPGENSTIMYIISPNVIHNSGSTLEHSDEVNITNDVTFMHDEGMNNHPGVVVSAEPKSEMIQNNESAVVSITFSALKSALPGDYWVTLPPGICFGGQMIVLTITDCTK